MTCRVPGRACVFFPCGFFFGLEVACLGFCCPLFSLIILIMHHTKDDKKSLAKTKVSLAGGRNWNKLEKVRAPFSHKEVGKAGHKIY